MLLEVNSHMSELTASVTAKQDVLEIVPMQLLLGGERSCMHVASIYNYVHVHVFTHVHCTLVHAINVVLLIHTEEQFYRFLTLSNERIARHRTQWITRLEKAMLNPEVL